MGPNDTQEMVLYFATLWRSCRTRKRFVKLMNGVFGMPRNQARALAYVAMRYGCRSYQDLWTDCFTFFIKYALEYLAKHNRADTPQGDQDKSPTERIETQ